MNNSLLKGSRYKILNTIGEGGMGKVYHVVDLLHNNSVALKQVLYNISDLEFSSQSPKTPSEQSLSNEFSILASLRHPNIVSVLDYGFDEARQAYFTMDLLTTPRTITEAANHLPFSERIQLLLQLLFALDYLHYRGVTHRDLKPANVLVDENNTVKVLDFGLALASDILRNTTKDGKISGTLAYIAPEVLLGKPATLASDLYAFGIIMYEVLMQEHPFAAQDTTSLIYNIVNQIPDYTVFEPKIANILSRLLAKDPKDRYTTVNILIDHLCEATNLSRPKDTLAIRESYLQAASFVGRDKEFKELEDLMLSLTDNGGATRLIAGESGVGKSRLLNELRVRALVEDIHVIRGQSVENGASPFKVWVDILRFILLFTEVDNDEARALKSIMPNIDTILGYDVGEVPELSAEGMKTRLINIISELIKRQSKPMILLLEDLHWADQASIETYAYLSRNIKQYQLLLLGSYRSDEAPDLPQQIPHAPIFNLQRLNREQIIELSISMIGQEGSDDKIIAFLQREAEGNIFFIIEILRMWANEAGDLRKIAETPIPDAILAGGILAIFNRRLKKLEKISQDILIQSAVFGRKIDPQLLATIYPDVDLEKWFSSANDIAILDIADGEWQFVHDKLREYLLYDLKQDKEKWQKSHLLAAETIEGVYPDDIQYIPALAYHYNEAKIANKAVSYLEQSAELVRFSDYHRTIEYIETALSYTSFEVTNMRRANWHALLQTAHYLVGENDNSNIHLQQVLHYIDAPTIPEKNLAAIIGIGTQLGQQILHRLFPKIFVGRQDKPHFNSNIYVSILNAAVVYIHQGKNIQTMLAILLSLNIVERIQPSERVSPAMSYGAFTAFTSMINLNGIAKHYYALAEKSLPQAPSLIEKQTLGLLGFYHAQRAEWETALQYIEACVEKFDAIGHIHNSDETRNTLGRIYGHLGEFEKGYQMLSESYLRAKDRRDEVIALSLYIGTLSNLIQSGNILSTDFEDITLLLSQQEMQKLLPNGWAANSHYQAGYYAIRAVYSAQIDDLDIAFEALATAIELYTKKLERMSTHFDLYYLVPQTCIYLLRLEHEVWKPEAKAKLHQWLDTSLAQLAKYANINTFAKARYYLLKGYSRAFTNEQEALVIWQEALALAQTHQMPYEEAMAHAVLYDTTAQDSHLSQMNAILERINVDIGAMRFPIGKDITIA